MDEDLAAAIEASLREMNINSSRSLSSTQQRYTTYNATSNYPSSYALNDSNPVVSSATIYELSTIEAENIYKFSELLEKIQQNGGDLIRDRQVQVDTNPNLHFTIWNI